MKKTISLIVLLSILVISCKKDTNTQIEVNSGEIAAKRFESNVFNFNYPEDWNITDNEKIEEGIYYVAVEKKGFDSSGLVTIISFEDLIDLDESIKMNIDELQNNPFVNNLNVASIKDTKFNTIEARASKFNFNTMGIKHEGVIVAFSSENNTVVILKQEALEDKKTNKEGFSTIENSFEIK